MGGAEKPILFNADDHYDFDAAENHMMAAAREYAGWGFQDYRRPGEGFRQGLDTPPVDWGINSLRKYGFLQLLARITRNSPPYMSQSIREELKERRQQSRAPHAATSASCAAGPVVLEAGRAQLSVSPATGAYEIRDAAGGTVWRPGADERGFGRARVEAGGKARDVALGPCDVKKNGTPSN
jgi:hypothetical protein